MSAQKEIDQASEETRPRILVVEDEVIVRMVLADVLRAGGYLVIEAATADEAIEVLNQGDQVSLVISDLRMPGSVDGVALARLIRSKFPVTKIVLASAHLTALDWAEHDGFFSKP